MAKFTIKFSSVLLFFLITFFYVSPVKAQDLAFNPSSVTLKVGEQKEIKIIGGTQPYRIEQISNVQIANGTINLDKLIVYGVGQGSGTITVSTSYPAYQKATLSIKVDPAAVPPIVNPPPANQNLTLDKSSLSLKLNESTTVKITDGTKPYRVKSGYDTTKVQASINNETLSVKGVGDGSATITIQDKSNPVKSADLSVSVSSSTSTGSNFEDELHRTQTVGAYVTKIYNWGLGIAVSVSALILIFAGYLYATSQGNQDSIKTAKDLIIGVLTGLVVIILAGVILRNIIGIKY